MSDAIVAVLKAAKAHDNPFFMAEEIEPILAATGRRIIGPEDALIDELTTAFLRAWGGYFDAGRRFNAETIAKVAARALLAPAAVAFAFPFVLAAGLAFVVVGRAEAE